MNILLLCEGDAETHDSWSGISKSVVEHLRSAGHTIFAEDVDLYGLRRWRELARSFSPDRQRWWVRYHLGASAFEARSRIAQRHLTRYRGRIDIVLQFGATFRIQKPDRMPLAIYCDSNIAMAQLGAETGFAEASPLSDAEIESVARREDLVYQDASVIMTFSSLLRETFVERFSIPKDRIRAVGAGPNLSVRELEENPKRSTDRPTILFVGRQFHRKGGDLMLQAFRAIRSTVPDARLVIIGPDALQEDLGPGVEFLGFLDRDDPVQANRLMQAYADADVFCLPTRFEPFGVSFLEAMRFGVPCVGPGHWAVPEMIIDGETGVLVPPEDKAALVEAVIRLLTDRDQANRLGEAGRKHAEQKFSWKAVTDAMLEAMDAVVQPTRDQLERRP